MTKLQKMIYISLLVAQGVIIGLIENMIPYPFSFCTWSQIRSSKFDYDRSDLYDEQTR